MFGLAITLISTLGATGMGSILKIFAGHIQSKNTAREAREKRKLFKDLKENDQAVEFQTAVFGETDEKTAMFTRTTRRIIALIGMFNFATISILCTIWPTAELVTFMPTENIQSFKILWGLIEFPINNESTVRITTGHIALSSFTSLGAIIGFYFTPGGSK